MGRSPFPFPPLRRGRQPFPFPPLRRAGQGGWSGVCRALKTTPIPTEAFKIGVAWQGSPEHKKDRQRSFRLAELETLSRVSGVRLFSLQKGFGAEQLADGSCRFPIVELGSRLGDLMDTAAVIKALDLIITADTALAHLAGRLELRCGLLSPSRRTGGGSLGGTILRGIPRCASSVRPDGETGVSSLSRWQIGWTRICTAISSCGQTRWVPERRSWQTVSCRSSSCSR